MIFSTLSAQENKTISFASRICLVRFVITSKFVHTLMIYKWPSALLKSLIAAIKNCVWIGYMDCRKQVMEAWNFCCHPIKMGGGIKKFNAF